MRGEGGEGGVMGGEGGEGGEGGKGGEGLSAQQDPIALWQPNPQYSAVVPQPPYWLQQMPGAQQAEL